ncbi:MULTISPECIES: DUF3015 domain-containing protein [unclassified Endozoicomonas]|uniref:DUF3015 domain-containing protein n=1 Tax=unclassified Endozoicomonas TaxID=2644528 RepID=UPI0021476B6B|nr:MULTISPECIES: DUF3015 domain-containing protein [unclassified Endozoicomonas]
MRSSKVLAVCAFAAVISTSATSVLAKDKTPGSGPNPFSDCGIGAALFPTVKWAAVSSNIIWDIGTTAVTSATASPETCNGKNVAVAQFIIDNYDNLAEETAEGQGEHLNAMLEIRGCSVAARQAITGAIRQEMTSFVALPSYSSADDAKKSAYYYQAVMSGVARNSASCAA